MTTVQGPPSQAPQPVAAAAEGRPAKGRPALWAAVAVGLVAAVLVAVLAMSDSALTRQVKSPLLGQPAPEIAGPTLDGGSFSLADQRGRWVLVNFFATWCVPCLREHPELQRFFEAHRQAGDATVVSVVYSDEVDRVRRFFAEESGGWSVLDDPGGRVALEYGVGKIPESYLVSPDGQVVTKVIGGVEAAGLERILAQAKERYGAAGSSERGSFSP
jgi:cytochrome c biogenesis protein CcmG/thiol:disulfide interchange protein DsbE